MSVRNAPPVRWRDDTGWEYRCEVCVSRGRACFWPLTDEFWDRKRGMQRCRACHRAHEAARGRERYRANTTARERKREAARRYRAAHPSAQRLLERAKWEAIKADPERHARYVANARERQRRYRERHAVAA